MNSKYFIPPGLLNSEGGHNARYFKSQFTFWLPMIYLLLFVISVSLWIVYEDEHQKNWWQLFVAFVVAIFYFYLFSTFYKNCNWVASLGLTLIPIFVIGLQFGNVNANMMNPAGFGFNVLIESDYKPYWTQNSTE